MFKYDSIPSRGVFSRMGDHRPVFLSGTASVATESSSVPLNLLLLTANIGSLFEEPTLIPHWCEQVNKQFDNNLSQFDFIAVHLQEVGGKDKDLTNLPQVLEGFTGLFPLSSHWCSGLISNLDVKNKFTALGAIYFVRLEHVASSLITLFDFASGAFGSLSDVPSSSPSLTAVNVPTFADTNPWTIAPKTRKGYIRTKWLLGKEEFEFADVHIMHDDDNTLSLTASPSVYSQTRSWAVREVLTRAGVIKVDQSDAAIPIDLAGSAEQTAYIDPASRRSDTRNGNGKKVFIFGDFNFRLCQPSLLRLLTSKFSVFPSVTFSPAALAAVETLSASSSPLPAGSTPGVFPTAPELAAVAPSSTYSEGDDVITAPKTLSITNGSYNLEPAHFFASEAVQREMLSLDVEVGRINRREAAGTLHVLEDPAAASCESVSPFLYELPVDFAPTFRLVNDGSGYSNKRAPAWCDRVFFNVHAARWLGSA
eukprot:GILI01008437.1.p1 GENE.GILI01008437.1~~GILI01008437.1.p1  ORF type:complete len:480 (+),score=135.36 GILI01008437.1:52-1491(+)